MSAGSVGQHGFSAIGTAAPLRLGQMVVRPPLVFDSLRSSSLRYWHGLILFFLRVPRCGNSIYYDPLLLLTADFKGSEYRHSGIAAFRGASARFAIEVYAALRTQSPAIIAA
jgi:hypothetical protein